MDNKSIIHYFIDAVKSNPDKLSLIYEDTKLTFKDVYRLVKRLVYNLESKGVKKNTICVVSLGNTVEYALLLLVAAEIECVLVTVAHSLPPRALEEAIISIDGEYLFTTPSVKEKYLASYNFVVEKNCIVVNLVELLNQQVDKSLLRELALKVNSLDADYILTMTSGSTGSPKPIMLTQRTEVLRSFAGAKDLYNLDQEVIIIASPIYHSLALRLVLLSFMTISTAVILKQFNTINWLRAVEKYRVTFTLAVSTHLEQLTLYLRNNNNFDLSSLKCLVSSSSLLSERVKNDCIELFNCKLHECYGTSEVGIVTNLVLEDGKKVINSVGKPLPYVKLKIVDTQNNELAKGKIGEITCKTITSFSGYYKKGSKTDEIVKNNYFYTGDLGFIDKDGYLYLRGRKKDLIITGGVNVFPADIEEVIAKVKGVKEVAVIGNNGDYLGEIILAVIVVENHGVLKLVKRACLAELADYQQPMKYQVLENLPRNSVGKIMKPKLREMFKDSKTTKLLQKFVVKR